MLYSFCFKLIRLSPVLTAVPLSIRNRESPCGRTERVCLIPSLRVEKNETGQGVGELERLFPILTPHTTHSWEGRKPPPHQPSHHCPLIPFHSQLCAVSCLLHSVVIEVPLITLYGSPYSGNTRARAYSFWQIDSFFKWMPTCAFVLWLIGSVWLFLKFVKQKIGLSFEQPTGCSGCKAGYTVTCSRPGMHFVFKINGINLLLSVRFLRRWKLSSYWKETDLILPEQTCNVQGRVETMDFCSHLNPFILSVVNGL